MKILAIETSCDDTCIALAECSSGKFKLILNLISSQIEIHRKWGGVYPALARREHQRNLVPLLEKSLPHPSSTSRMDRIKAEAESVLKEILERENILYKQLKEFLEKYEKPKIDLIAVTMGPGLDPCLWTGVNFARALSYYWNIPIIGINHIEAHIIANWLRPIGLDVKSKNEKIKFPAIALIVSGGHTQLILIKKLGNYKNHASLRSAEPSILTSFEYKILGETRDDAAGEAFDKIARILGLDYPGGPAIAAAALSGKASKGSPIAKLPRPMLNTKNYDFSFSGLKTAVLYDYKKRTKKERESKEYIQAMAREAQQAIIDVLIKKTIKAAKDYRVKSILLGGGVTANKELRKQFQQRIEKENFRFNLYISSPEYCTDNAAMIAATACFQKSARGLTSNSWQNIKAKPNLRISDD